MLHDIGSLVFLALFFVLVFEFLRGIRVLGQIAARLERIEHILTKGSPGVPNQSASHTAT